MVEITLDGPGKNALGTTTMTTLLARLDGANGEPVLLTGAGDAFSAGLDLKEVASLDPAGMERFLRLLERTMARLFQYPGPIVAAVNGHAIAGGCVVALCCDHRVVARSEKLRMGLNEVALGLRFPPRVLRICRDRVPRHLHATVLLGAGLVGPETALAQGLVDELADDPVAVARERLAAFAKHPNEAYAATKADLRGRIEEDLASEDDERRFFAEGLSAWTSDALKARIRAVLKR